MHQLYESCKYPKNKALSNLLPALLIWDVRHPEEAIFVPVSLIGFSKKVLPVFEWSVRPLDPDLLEALGGLPRERRSVPPDLAARFCPELIIRYGVAIFNKMLDSSPLRHRNREHWQREAANLFGILGLPVPTEVDETLRHREGLWRQQALDRCGKQWGNQLTMDAFIIKPVVHSDEHLAAGVDMSGIASRVLFLPSKRRRWIVGFSKKERLAHRHFWLKDHERSRGEAGSAR